MVRLPLYRPVLRALRIALCVLLVALLILGDLQAALIVAVVYGIVAYVLVNQGQARMKRAVPPVPTQTIETVKEDVEWAKTRATSARK